jgi:hypothetical protein
MGAVYRAVHSKLGKSVALKILTRQKLGDEQAVSRFHREMKAVGQLSHPNIVQATDAGEADGCHFLVMEYVAGADAARLLRRGGPMSVANACEIVRQGALGLECAHRGGIVHRDVKPSNLLVGADGGVKVADLGLALSGVPLADGTATTSHLVLGSIDYMAPEQCDDPHAVDARADLYALGCTLYHMLAGQPPFAGTTQQTPLQKLKAHATTDPLPLHRRRPEIPKKLTMIVSCLLAKNPADRFPSAAELARALVPFTTGHDLPRLVGSIGAGTNGDTVVRSPDLPSRVQRKRRAWWLAGLIGAIALIVASVVIYVKTDRGIVEVQTDDEDVKIVVEKNGEVIEILDAKANKQYRLATGEVKFRLISGDKDLELKPTEAVLRRGDKQVVVVTRLSKANRAAGEFSALDPKWVRMVEGLPAAKQVEEVKKELVARNPGFKGEFAHAVNSAGAVSMVSIHSGDVIDLTPLRVFKDLEQLECVNNRVGDRGPLDDLRPLAGMRLKRLDLSRNTVGDLTPLKGMPLEHLNCQVTGISDLSPLKEIKTLKTLSCHGTIVRDLTPLKDLKNLRQLDCGFSQVGDLSPLKGLQLEKLHIVGCGELDLEPLRGMPLIVFDYELRLNREMDVEIVKSMPKLKEIRGKPAAEVLKGGN